MDPITSRVSISLPDPSDASNAGAPAKGPKNGASKFDQVQKKLKGEAADPSPQAQSISANSGIDKAQLQTSQPNSLNRVQEGLAAGQHHLQRLKDQVTAVQDSAAKRGIQERLASVEQQYTKLDSAIKGIPPNAGVQQLMAVQQQVYSMNENISTLSKIVGQASSGVKSILQTQV